MTTEGRPKIVEIETDSGVILHVTPLLPTTWGLAREKARLAYPDPDPKPFEVPLPNAAIAGDMIPATENAEYLDLLNQTEKDRQRFIERFVLQNAVAIPEGMARVKERFATRLKAIQGLDPELDIDNWFVVFDHVICNNFEKSAVILAAENRMPLTEAEIAEGFRFFRLEIQWQDFIRTIIRQQISPSRP